MSLANIRSKLKTGLETISGLNVASYIPDVIVLPLAILSLKPDNPVEFDYTAKDSNYIFHFLIDVLVNKGASVVQAQTDLDPYIDPTQTSSIKKAVEAVSFGTDASTYRLIGSPTYGVITIGSTDYMAVRFSLDVWV